jgi:hypothetical protein
VKRAVSKTVFIWIIIPWLSVLQAAEPAATPAASTAQSEEAQPLSWLRSGDYPSLERYYSQQQRDYEAGIASDQVLYANFRKLYEDSLDNELYFDRWVQAFPTSYSAHLAQGAYLYRMAWSVRGNNYRNQTAQTKFDAMENWLARARPELIASLRLTAKPFLSTLYLLNTAMLSGSAAERQHWFEVGSSIDPANTLLRYRYMFSLRPRWGGSYAQMEAFLRQCEEEHQPPMLLARLRMLIDADLAEDAMRVGDQNKVFEEWGEVLRLADIAGESPSDEAVIGYTRAALDLNKPAEVERGIKKLEGRKFDDAWSLARVGFIYGRSHREAQGWPLLVRAAELDDPWAQFIVGSNTYDGIPSLQKSADQAAGLIWIRRSAQQCFPDALRFLAAHGEVRPSQCSRNAFGGIWWEALLRWGAPALLTSLILAWVQTRRTRARAPDEAGRLQHPPRTLFMAIGIFVLFAGLAVLFFGYANGTGAPLVSSIFAAFAVLLLLMVSGYYRARYELTAHGINYGRLLGARGSLKWRDVTHLTYSPWMRRFRIETSSGEVARISAMLRGLPDFAQAVLAQVPSYAIDERALAVLKSSSQGELAKLG